jgi:hypothetical protein
MIRGNEAMLSENAMKRTLTLLLSSLILPLLLATVATLIFLPSRASAAGTKSVTVDYVIGLLDAGVAEDDVVTRIKENHLTFRVAPGDIDRLMAAGATGHLIDEIINAGVTLENREGAPSGDQPGGQNQGGTDTNGWGRPSRMGTSGKVAPPAGGDYQGDGQGIEEIPDGGSYAYPGNGYYYPSYYYPSYFGFGLSYGYSYPYYYPYYSSYYYPYYNSYHCPTPYHYSNGGGGYRTAPRGGGGSFHTGPRGGGGMSAPHGGGMSAPHGGGGHRPSPRGSGHH